jgi:CRISPR-associated endonuclease/helicase Cas3
MDALSIDQFTDFFLALHGREPFPWQTMLLRRVMERGWPELLDLPTASGKTACIDVAVFALALQADKAWQQPTTPRRLFFVVDRRIVVDEAHERASRIAKELDDAGSGVLAEVAKRLRRVSMTELPLATARLRGGVVPDNGWANIPTQPAIVTGTVDQVGSRLLFRSYGCSARVAPIHAALVAYDSLIVLDEAHCSEPFKQTICAVRDYLDPDRWAEDRTPVAPRLQLMRMTATPSPDADESRFPQPTEREQALAHPALRERHDAQKLARLELVKNKEFIRRAAAAVQSLLEGNPQLRRLAVMVNRVQTARDVYDLLRSQRAGAADVELLTGQLRPIDRDDLIRRLQPALRSGSDEAPERPIILVTTQCLEVGADFDFDALVTECASLDALQQRFGRLDRLGKHGETQAVILAQQADVAKDADDDFVYGPALKETWAWLKSIAADGVVDLGINTMNGMKASLGERVIDLLAPKKDAPVLMPAHVDLLCQTAPRPEPDPDVSVFLHGLELSRPEVFVAFRADLPADRAPEGDEKDAWLDAIRLIPPLPAECLSVPLHRFHALLRGDTSEPDADVEGAKVGEPAADSSPVNAHFVLWRYRDSLVTDDPRRVRPGDTVVFPADATLGGGDKLASRFGLPDDSADRAEEAYLRAQRMVVLRVHPAILKPPAARPLIEALAEEHEQEDAENLTDALTALAEETSFTGTFGEALVEIARELTRERGRQVLRHPIDAAARVITYRRRLTGTLADLPDLEDDSSERPVENADARSLDHHTAAVMGVVEKFARVACDRFADLFQLSARWHDAGKLDERLQFCLADGQGPPNAKLAKSDRPIGPPRWRQLTRQAGLPAGFRHEMLSVQIATDILPDGPETDLALHLVGAHHGHARPWAPVIADDEPRDVNGTLLDTPVMLDAATRAQSPPHALDSGIADRFWRLTRRFGWWGLAYLESVLRLADWYASARPPDATPTRPPSPRAKPPGRPTPRVHPDPMPLAGIDGGNLLGFLAAMGAFRVVTEQIDPECRMSWHERGSALRPALHLNQPLTPEQLIAGLADIMASDAADHPILHWERWSGKSPAPCRQTFDGARREARSTSRVKADFLAAIGSDLLRQVPFDSPLRAPREDYLLGNLRTLLGVGRPLVELRGALVATLSSSLLRTWTYSDPLENCSLKLDAFEDLRYALRWSNPSGDPVRKKRGNMVGANRLAIEVFPLFTGVTRSGDFATVAFHRDTHDGGWRVTWPLWRPPLRLDTVRPLLAFAWLGADDGLSDVLQRRGIAAVYQCARETVGKTRVFTPARLIG